jgi:hypothetical protein
MLRADNEQRILHPKSVYGIDFGDNFQGDGSYWQVKRLDHEDLLASGDGRSGIFTWREEP